MTKRIYLALLALSLLAFASCKSEQMAAPNGDSIYNHVTLSIDENDFYAQVGHADYVFVGTVMDHVENTYADGRAKTLLQIAVDKNMKGCLQDEILATRNIGYDDAGTLILNATDNTAETGLPAIGESYIFVGYGQPDGSLTLADIVGHTEYTEAAEASFIDYVAGQTIVDRERFSTSFEAS